VLSLRVSCPTSLCAPVEAVLRAEPTISSLTVQHGDPHTRRNLDPSRRPGLARHALRILLIGFAVSLLARVTGIIDVSPIENASEALIFLGLVIPSGLA